MLEAASEHAWVLKTVTATSQLSVQCFFPTEHTFTSPSLRQKTTKQVLHTYTIFISNIHTWLKNEKIFYLVLKYIRTKKNSDWDLLGDTWQRIIWGRLCVCIEIYYREEAEKIKAISTIHILAAALYIMTSILVYIWET